jgi:hypothetical protein
MLLTLLASAAQSHTAPAGWEYDRECCSVHDCSPVADGVVQEVAGGYAVTLRYGDHPMVRENTSLDFFVPHGDPSIRVSGDGHKHVCLSGYGTLYCIYVPPGGV